MTENNFCVRRKNRRKHNQYFKRLFFKNKCKHWGVKLSVYIYVKVPMQAHEQIKISTVLQSPKVWAQFVDGGKRTHLESFFPSHQQSS